MNSQVCGVPTKISESRYLARASKINDDGSEEHRILFITKEQLSQYNPSIDMNEATWNSMTPLSKEDYWSTTGSVKEWMLRDLIHCGKFDSHILVGSDPNFKFTASIYTDRHRYCINVDLNDHLTCAVTNPEAYTGEYRLIGDKLAEGSVSEETWHKILASIVVHEMVSLYQARIDWDVDNLSQL
jgi:hypothetical protein